MKSVYFVYNSDVNQSNERAINWVQEKNFPGWY